MKITNTNAVELHHIFALIVGESGVGKTTLAATLNHDETLILSAESGLLSIKDSNIDVININTMKDLYEAFAYIQTDAARKYKNIFIDSLTELSEIIFHDLKDSDNYSKSQTFALYGDYSEKLIKLLKAFRDLSQFNIYMTCLEKVVTKDYQEVIAIDVVQKSLSDKVIPLFDMVFHYRVLTNDKGETKRALCTDRSTSPLGKSRASLEPYEKPDLNIIAKKIFGASSNE